MIQRLTRVVPSPAAARRSRSRGSEKRAEARLERACAWGAGHVLVTGRDRADARALLERVLRRIEPLGTVGARACSPDPDTALDSVFALTADEGPLPVNRRERRQALLKLIESARSMRRSIFVVVDDGDDATIEQLERLRVSVEVTPEALERLRLVFLGGPTLVAKLNHSRARALSSRITSRIRVDTGARATHRAAAFAETLHRPEVTLVAGTCCALLAYGVARVVLPSGAVDAPSTHPVQSLSTPTIAASTPVRSPHATTALHGDEPFLGRRLEIPIHPQWTTGSALFPPPKPADSAPEPAPAVQTASAAERPPETAASPPPAPQRPPVAQAPRAVAPVVSAQQTPPVKVSTELVEGTSIAALVARFR